MKKIEDNILQLLSADGYGVLMQNAGIFRFPASFRFETHSHGAIEINYINTGCCIMGVGDHYVPLKQGDCIIINPYIPHCFMVDVVKACKITQVELAVSIPAHVNNKISFLEYEDDYYKLNHCEHIVRLLENVCYCYRMKGDTNNAKAQYSFAIAQMYAALSYEIDVMKSKTKLEKNDKVGEMIRYINENLENDLKLEELSEQFGISSRYVRKYFLQNMGMKCTEYINILRIGKAKELLCEPSNSVTDVALMTGFNSSQYFCRIFRRQMGMTPVEYCRMWRKDIVEIVNE